MRGDDFKNAGDGTRDALLPEMPASARGVGRGKLDIIAAGAGGLR